MSKQVARPVAAIPAVHTAKAREDMGCLTLTWMLMGFSKNDLQLQALFSDTGEKINIGGEK